MGSLCYIKHLKYVQHLNNLINIFNIFLLNVKKHKQLSTSYYHPKDNVCPKNFRSESNMIAAIIITGPRKANKLSR